MAQHVRSYQSILTRSRKLREETCKTNNSSALLENAVIGQTADPETGETGGDREPDLETHRQALLQEPAVGWKNLNCHCWVAPCWQVWELKAPGGPSHGASSALLWVLLPGASQWISREKFPALGENYFARPNNLWFSWSLTYLGEGKYPTLAPASQFVSSKGKQLSEKHRWHSQSRLTDLRNGWDLIIRA